MFNGRIGFDGNATAKTFVTESYFRPPPKSRKKADGYVVGRKPLDR